VTAVLEANPGIYGTTTGAAASYPVPAPQNVAVGDFLVLVAFNSQGEAGELTLGGADPATLGWTWEQRANPTGITQSYHCWSRTATQADADKSAASETYAFGTPGKS
jgi:hypothetical protein